MRNPTCCDQSDSPSVSFPFAPLIVPALILAFVLFSGCKTIETPVPVYGPEDEVASLAGEWYGEYSSREAGRHGVIYFKLEADADSAVGHVIMKPGNVEDDFLDDVNSAFNQPSELLTIRFVSFGGGHVVGSLNEYRDPVCGCRLETTFEGHLAGDRIEGIYASHGEGFHLDTTGNWWVKRVSRQVASE